MLKVRKGFTLVEIMIIVLIIAILASIAIPNLLRARITANDSVAQGILKSVANALENYAAIHSVYPSDTTQLIGTTPPYLAVDYFTGIYNGYTFTSVLSDYFYTITAAPTNGLGTSTFTITTGGMIEAQ